MTTTRIHRTAVELREAHLAWTRRHTHPKACPCADCREFFAPLPEDDEPFEIDQAETAADAAPRGHGTGTGSGRTVEGASEKQVRFIARLAAEKGVDARPVATKKAASAEIDRLIALPAPQAPAADGPALGGVTGRFVKIGSDWCVKVSGSAAPGETVTVRKGNGDEKIVRLGVAVAPFTYAIAADAPTAPAADLPAVPDGRYAVTSTGDNDLVFYLVQNGEGRWAGRTFVKMVVGGHADQNVRRDAVAGILARIVDEGIEASALRFGQELGICCRCGRHLTDDQSRAAGIGPDCAKKGW